jgi:hypothetical protein
MEQRMDAHKPGADVMVAQSWLAVGIAVGSGLGVVLGHIALGVGLGLVLGVAGAVVARDKNSDRTARE